LQTRQAETQIEEESVACAHRQTDRQTDRQTETDRQTDRQTDEDETTQKARSTKGLMSLRKVKKETNKNRRSTMHHADASIDRSSRSYE